jgi:hypothetical protein
MSAMTARRPQIRSALMTEAGTTEFQWTVHPARERPVAAVGAAAIIALFAGATYVFSERESWALFVTGVFCLAMNRFFFPTVYRFTADGVAARFPLLRTRTLSWSEARRIDLGSHAAWISPCRRRSWREHRRGVHILFGRRRERVLRELGIRAPDAMPDRSDEYRGTEG